MLAKAYTTIPHLAEAAFANDLKHSKVVDTRLGSRIRPVGPSTQTRTLIYLSYRYTNIQTNLYIWIWIYMYRHTD